MNDTTVRLPRGGGNAHRGSLSTHASARVGLGEARQEGQIDVARGALRMIVETAEYVSDRTTHLSSNAAEGMKALDTLSAVARQVRTLSSNTSLEASRLGGNATVAEIARQMRLLSQQVTALSDHLSTSLHAQDVALGELSGAIDAILADATSTQVILERRLAGERGQDNPSLVGLLQSVPESITVLETPSHGH